MPGGYHLAIDPPAAIRLAAALHVPGRAYPITQSPERRWDARGLTTAAYTGSQLGGTVPGGQPTLVACLLFSGSTRL